MAAQTRSRGGAILFSEMTPAREWEDRFNNWYDTHHIPIRLEQAPGFLSARRYNLPDRPHYLAVYELADPGALSTPAYTRIKNNPSEETRFMLDNVTGFTRYIYSEIDCAPSTADLKALNAPVLYAVFADVPEAHLETFDSWYQEEHIPLLLECEEWLMCRRFAAVSGVPSPANRLALHYLADRGALESEARKKARATAWRRQLGESDWFKPSYLVFNRIGAFGGPA